MELNGMERQLPALQQLTARASATGTNGPSLRREHIHSAVLAPECGRHNLDLKRCPLSAGLREDNLSGEAQGLGIHSRQAANPELDRRHPLRSLESSHGQHPLAKRFHQAQFVNGCDLEGGRPV